MFASRHALFVGPGRLPKELRELLHLREGQAVPDLTIRGPTLLATFKNATDAERVAAQLERLRIAVLVAGPEQPPPTEGWLIIEHAEVRDGGWLLRGARGEEQFLLPGAVTAISTVQWLPAGLAIDRGMLLRVEAFGTPVYLRASSLNQVDGLGGGLRRLHELAEDIGSARRPGLKVRERKVDPAIFERLELQGDRLALAVAMVDALDSHPAALPERLSKSAPPLPQLTAEERASLLPQALGVASLLTLALALFVAGLALLDFSVNSVRPMLLAIMLAGWGSLRLYWARWYARRFGTAAGWPLPESDDGAAPTRSGLWVDVAVPLASWLALSATSPTKEIAVGALVGSLGLGVLSWLALTRAAD